MRYELSVLRGREGISALTLNALTEHEAAQQAQRQGYTVLSVKSAGSIQALFKRNAAFPLLLFSQELRSLLKAGLSVVEALDVLTRKESRVSTRDVLQQISRQLHEGLSFSDALKAQPAVFPELYVSTLRAAEVTSDLGVALSRYISYQLQMEAVRRKVVSAAVYPALLLVVGGAVILFLMTYVVPRFSGIYESARGQLPWMSQWLLLWGKLLREHAWMVTIAVLALSAAAVYGFTRPGFRERMVRWLWRVPAVGARMHVFQLSRLYRTLGMLLSGGISMVTAAEMAGGAMPAAMRKQLSDAIQALRQGMSISQAMEDHGLTTEVAATMLRVGERTGNMGEMMDNVAAFYEEDMTRWVDWFSRLFEPLLMTAIGLVVGIIVVLMYVPIFELASSLQ